MLRNAEISDIDAIMQLCRAMYDEATGLHGCAFSEGVSRETIIDTISNGFAVVYTVAHKIVGLFGGKIAQPHYSRDLIAIDNMFYVAPKYRNGFAAVAMVQAFTDWAILSKVKPCNIFVGVNSGIDNEMVAQFYEILGFARWGIQLRYGG